MKVNIDLNKSNLNNYITDELRSNVGSSAFMLEHDFFFDGTDFQIWTGPGMSGTKLNEGSDYIFTGKHLELSQRANGNVYQYVTILNATYQTGDLYFNYHACADWIEAEDQYSLVRSEQQYIKVLDTGDIDLFTSLGDISIAAINSFGVLIGASDDSTFVVDSAQLTLETLTTGDLVISSASSLTINDQYQTSAINFSETDADGLSANFGYDTQTDFNWTVRGVNSPTSLLAAINSNRDDLYEYVELVSTKGAAVGVAAGANLIGCDGITNVTPEGKTAGSDANLQEMLEGFAKLPLPIGTILMYDGSSWVDDETIPGWYACTAANSAHGAPDLENKFIRGGTTAGATGGTNDGSHLHDISHTHGTDSQLSNYNASHNHAWATTASSGTHSMIVSNTAGAFTATYYSYNSSGNATSLSVYGGAYGWAHMTGTYYTNNQLGTITLSHSHSTNSQSVADSATTTLDNQPSYYQVIYIRKCYN